MLKAIRQARAAISMLNPDEVRKRGERRLHVGLVASGPREYEEMEAVLFAAADDPESRGYVHRAADPTPPPEVDLVFYDKTIDPVKGTFRLDPDEIPASVAAVLKENEELGLPMARQFPAFRRTVVERIVQAVARENALFAIATALPNVVPNLIELPWAFGEFASDTAFLTANQIRMAFLIAGACGKEIGFSQQRGEVISIVGSAFGWRAVARELAGKIPLGGGLIPKGAIAYAGTYAVGKGLEYYHRADLHYTAEESEGIYRQAVERGRQVVQSLSFERRGNRA